MNLNMNTVNAEGSDIQIINNGNPGICENIKMTAIEIGTASSGSGFIKFTFEDEAGGSVNLFEFDVQPTDEKAENKTASQLKRLKHIVTKFVPEGTPLPEATSFPEMYTKLEQLLLQNNYQAVMLRAKLVYNTKNYISFPKYVPFLESMDVDAANSRLKMKSIEDGGIDKMVKTGDDNPSDLTAPPVPDANSPFFAPPPTSTGTGSEGVYAIVTSAEEVKAPF